MKWITNENYLWLGVPRRRPTTLLSSLKTWEWWDCIETNLLTPPSNRF